MTEQNFPDMNELQQKGFGDVANAMMGGAYVPEAIMEPLERRDWDGAERGRMHVVAFDLADHVTDGSFENWDIHGNDAAPWTWSVDQQIDTYLRDVGDPDVNSSHAPDRYATFVQDLDENQQANFEAALKEAVAVKTAEEIANSPSLSDDETDPQVVQEALDAMPSYRDLVSTDEHRARVDAAIEEVREAAPATTATP